MVPTDRAGAVSRGLAMAIDGVFVNLAFTAFVALVTLVGNAFGGNGEGGGSVAIAVGSTAWLSFGAVYLLGFWSLAGQTPGMRFVGIRLEGALPLGAASSACSGWGSRCSPSGSASSASSSANRGAPGTTASRPGVVYDERRPEPAPWSEPRSALPSDSAAGAEPAG